MLAIKLDPTTEERLEEFARKLGKSKDDLGREAIKRLMEDLEDYVLAEAGMRDFDPAKTTSLEELKRDLGLDG
ncbi:type II toxin-antitoxin system RelB family antitoxin [Sphingomonas sp.]|jgi:predicted DNA-binding protein|uniref:type II toxin-antitoxin system RelB family antitoxin n=1 Tax=Sphingomonas sp. TaxID=28214 RepID=UPI002DBA53CE|nr:CopG family transcriptional regulator [Sphingomonas sp.]HEU4969250.1 CopG family transcriptional regulator [Sphingomonas sp.]